MLRRIILAEDCSTSSHSGQGMRRGEGGRESAGSSGNGSPSNRKTVKFRDSGGSGLKSRKRDAHDHLRSPVFLPRSRGGSSDHLRTRPSDDVILKVHVMCDTYLQIVLVGLTETYLDLTMLKSMRRLRTLKNPMLITGRRITVPQTPVGSLPLSEGGLPSRGLSTTTGSRCQCLHLLPRPTASTTHHTTTIAESSQK